MPSLHIGFIKTLRCTQKILGREMTAKSCFAGDWLNPQGDRTNSISQPTPKFSGSPAEVCRRSSHPQLEIKAALCKIHEMQN